MSNHVERNDGLKDGNKLALKRYYFANYCLKNRGLDIADAGCGYGYGTYLLKKCGHNVCGIDYSKEAIDYCQKNYPGNYFVRDLNKEKISEIFDVVVCLETLCHLNNPKEFIDNIKCNELIISSPIDPDPNDGYKYRLNNLSEKEFRELLKNWTIIKEMWQGNKQKYLTVYCIK